ncbi:MAG TPA: peroxiredoxin family protein [Alphaproteobacteria bacterium]|nr:peroxiredoxin family protein [Alphaproteobacteria bacterium]
MRATQIFLLGWIAMLAAPLAAAAPAYDKLGRGPGIGQPLPVKLVAPDQDGKTRNLASLTGKRGLLLVFNRSVDWCVYCRAEAVAWNRRLGEVRALGYEVAVISYDSLSAIKNFSEGRGIKYTLLSDKGSKIIRAFGLLNEDHAPGTFGHGIPHPIVFAIDPKGVIRHRFSEATYRRRPDIDVVLKVLRGAMGNAG